MKRHRLDRGILAASVCLAALGAGAARAQTATVLDTIVVDAEVAGADTGRQGASGDGAATGMIDPGLAPVQGYVAKRTQTGMKTATPLNEIPQAVSVVGREEIEARGAEKVDEALRYTAGVFAQPFGTDSDTDWYFIRGFQATTTGDYLDGLQIPSYAFGDIYVDAFGLERVEVLKGPASVLYGGSNPGGIVNSISKRPTGERLRYTETGVNDAGTAYFGFDFGDRLDDVQSWRVDGKVQGGRGYSDFEDGWRGFIAPSYTWRRDEENSFTVLANYTHIDEVHNGGSFLPYVGTVVPASSGYIGRDANFTEPALDYYERDQISVGYEAEIGLADRWSYKSSARLAYADIGEHNLYPDGFDASDPTMLNRVNFRHHTRVTNLLSDNRIEGGFATGAIDHQLLLGVEAKSYWIDQVQESGIFGTTTPISAFDPVYGVFQPDPVSYLNQELSQKQAGIYAQDQLRFGGGFIVTLNGRYDHVWTESDDGPTYYSPAQDAHEETDSGAWSGRAGIAYEFENGLTPYVSVASFFNPVIGTDANGAFFEPEDGEQYEVGLKYEPTFVDGSLTFSLFDLTRRNVAVTDPNDIFNQVQRGEVRSRGIEVEGKVNLLSNLALTGAFTAFDLEITEDADAALIGKRPTIVPEVQASAWLDYTVRGAGWIDGATLGAGVRYQGETYADAANTLKVPDATLLDLKVGYEKDDWGVRLNVDNVFDKRYVASCQTANVCSYGEGRSFQVSLHKSW